MSPPVRLAPPRAALAGLALLTVLSIAVAAVLLATGDAAGRAGGHRVPAAATGAPGTGSPAASPLLAPPAAVPQTPVSPAASTPASRPASTAAGAAPHRVAPPRLIAIAPRTVPEDVLRRVAALEHVDTMVVADGGAIRFSAATLNLLAVDPAEFRPWSPRPVAERTEVWDALTRGEFVAESATAGRYLLQLGGEYDTGGNGRLRVAASAPLGLPGVDGLVGREAGRALGLTPGVALLVRTPVARVAEVGARIGRILGRGAQVVPVGARRPAATPSAAPPPAPSTAQSTAPSATPGAAGVVGRPASYLDLYKVSAGVCPGLSWTVLAAIGQVESGHGRNNGPSSAGALGPMQFMPATWRAYGMDGDGDGKKDIWSAYDAVPAAAGYLCANGAAGGGARLRGAVFRYNHSWDYVNKVLGIADAYARAYR
ncbi:hypothetical protein Sru01_13830 [Sphaerisporangium rufum]|uniref:Transglycosylase SLT domain-containing protein n=1 Tax=Sphaerisporangium rufum TaxID=1381558 RepID=A0A919QYE7_9ACTN|nr:lytic transglycosylase domain-containing protein [Sphaerisporangium rufum]GII76401.1 hypothetical protein Sru01_13830 [Sphaerisporangium rufum]